MGAPPGPPPCPVCAGPLDASHCGRCGLTWRTPSARSSHVGPGGSGASSRSLAFRPRLGEVIATLGAVALYAPVAAAVFGSAVEIGQRPFHGATFTSYLLMALLFLVVVTGGVLLFAHAATLGARLISPPALTHDAEIFQVRPGGFGGRGRVWHRFAKLDLREVVLDPHEGGFLYDLLVTHRAGPALLLATALPREDAERLARTIAGWLSSPGQAAMGYRTGMAR